MKTYDYRYRLSVAGGHAGCRIRVYRMADETICLATEQHDKFGGHLLAENTLALATQVERWHNRGGADRVTWVEQDDYPEADGPTRQRETFAIVSFDHGVNGALSAPRRRAVDRAAIEALIGQSIDN